MKIILLTIGKTDAPYLQEGIKLYTGRLAHYTSFEMKCIPDLKNTAKLSEQQQREKEGELILNNIGSADQVVLLDERGKHFTSVEFSAYIQKQQLNSVKTIIFVIGGPYGFSEAVYKRASLLLSLSNMTFSHQMVRLIFAEQLYRAFTIIKGEPYHHA